MSAPDSFKDKTKVAIVGAGLSGLYAAYLLERQGIKDYLIFESRDRVGGRIESGFVLSDNGQNDVFDLGPTWCWPEFQTQLKNALDRLGITLFEQYETGDVLLERGGLLPTSRQHGYTNQPTSMRLNGGMNQLINALLDCVAPSKIHTSHKVQSITYEASGRIKLDLQVGVNKQPKCITAQSVMLALPPRLAGMIEFSPKLPNNILNQWLKTETWMAPHAKYLAVYDRPFWREKGLSGQARSSRGPMIEIHDASPKEGAGALFGFVGIPASSRKNIPEKVIEQACNEQLGRLFGKQAAKPKKVFFKDWAADKHTSTISDLNASGQHITRTPYVSPLEAPWQNCLWGVASEWSPAFPGYLAGAVDAAERGVRQFIQQQELSNECV